MALTRRFLRLFQADIHGVLDRLEEPELALKQALREMVEELERAELVATRQSRESEIMDRRLAELAASKVRAEQELDLCFEAGNEALARTLLRRKLETEKLSRHLERKHQELEEELCKRREQLEKNRGLYESARQKAEVLAEENPLTPVPDDRDSLWRTREFSVRDEEVEIAMLQEQQRRAEHGRETA